MDEEQERLDGKTASHGSQPPAAEASGTPSSGALGSEDIMTQKEGHLAPSHSGAEAAQRLEAEAKAKRHSQQQELLGKAGDVLYPAIGAEGFCSLSSEHSKGQPGCTPSHTSCYVCSGIEHVL